MNAKILLVDDEPNLLHSLRRSLRGKFDLAFAESGKEAIDILQTQGPFAVIVSDMQMPEMDGLTLLRTARKMVPDTVRMMLTGNVDQQTAVDAVNDGAIFRFLNKPCSIEKLTQALEDAIRQYSLVTAEKTLLSQTLTGSVALITELLALANPEASGRGSRLRGLARRIAEKLKWSDAWQFEIAAMLSQVGCMEAHADESLSGEELLQHQAELGGRIVARIPRLEQIAKMIERQFETNFSSETPTNLRNGAKMLRVLNEYDWLSRSYSLSQSLKQMEQSIGSKYDEEIFEALVSVLLDDMELRSVTVQDLVPHMIVEQHVLNSRGDILISQGHELTENLIERLLSFRRNSSGVREPIEVRCPRAFIRSHATAHSVSA